MKAQDGFTLIEVLVAIAVLTIGILAMQVMQATSINQNATSGTITAKSMTAAGQIEFLMTEAVNDLRLEPPTSNWIDRDGDGTNQDTNLDGMDDDDDTSVSVTSPDEDFGLRHAQCCPGGVDPRGNAVPGCIEVADYCSPPIVGEDYEIYWNIAVDHPVENMKTINIIVFDSKDKGDSNTEAVNRAEYRYVRNYQI